MTNEELWEHIGKVIDAKLDQKLDEKLEPIKQNMATKADIHEIAENMAGFFSWHMCKDGWNKWGCNGHWRPFRYVQLERELIPLPERAGAFPNLLRWTIFIISTSSLERPERIQRILS